VNSPACMPDDLLFSGGCRVHALCANRKSPGCLINLWPAMRYGALHVTIASGRVRLETAGGAKIAR
jgi:hypothetical protein